MFDSVFFHNDNRFLKRIGKIYNFDLKDWEFQTKSLVNQCQTFYINNDNKLTHDGIWLEKFTGSFDIYSSVCWEKTSAFIWFDLFLIIENGMLQKTIIERITVDQYSHIIFGKSNFENINIPFRSRNYLEGMLEKNEKNRNRF